MFGDWKLHEVPAWNLLSQPPWTGYRPIPASSPHIPLGPLRGEISAASVETRQPIPEILPTNEWEFFANRTDPSLCGVHTCRQRSAHQPLSSVRCRLEDFAGQQSWRLLVIAHQCARFGCRRQSAHFTCKTSPKTHPRDLHSAKARFRTQHGLQVSLTLRQQARRSAQLPDSGLRREAGHY